MKLIQPLTEQKRKENSTGAHSNTLNLYRQSGHLDTIKVMRLFFQLFFFFFQIHLFLICLSFSVAVVALAVEIVQSNGTANGPQQYCRRVGHGSPLKSRIVFRSRPQNVSKCQPSGHRSTISNFHLAACTVHAALHFQNRRNNPPISVQFIQPKSINQIKIASKLNKNQINSNRKQIKIKIASKLNKNQINSNKKQIKIKIASKLNKNQINSNQKQIKIEYNQIQVKIKSKPNQI